MSPACGCGARNAIRHANETSRTLRLDGARAVRVPCAATRFLCRSCGATFLVKDPVAVSHERAVREHVAERVFAMGRDAAAREAGVSTSTVVRLMRDWRLAREDGVGEAAPDFLILDVVVSRGEERVLVMDVDGEALVEVLESRADLPGWLERPERLPALRACVPVDAEVAAIVRKGLPGAVLMIAPSAAWRAVRSALAAGLGVLRRDPSMSRRNGFPGTAGFLRALDGRTRPGEGWPREVLALLTAGRAARDLVAAPDAAGGRRLWPEMEAAMAIPGGAPLARFLAAWRDALLSGLDHRFVDRAAGLVAQVRRLVVRRRPALAFQEFRAFVLLRDHTRPGPSAHGTTRGVHGRPLDGLLALLALPGACSSGAPA